MPETIDYEVEAEAPVVPPEEPTTGTVFGDADSEGNPLPIPLGDLDSLGTALARIWKQFEQTVTWPQLMAALGTMTDDIEQSAIALQPMRYVGSARGVWLDELGAMVGRPRGGQTDDDDYRAAIIAEALSLITSGAPDELIDIAVRLAPEGADVFYDEPSPATFIITITDLDADTFLLYRSITADMVPAGVGGWLATYSTTLTAGWGSVYGDVSPAGSWSSVYGGADDALSLWSWGAPIGG